MKRFAPSLALAVLAVTLAVPALARDFVQDQAAMFSPATVAQLNSTIGNFNAQTGKEVLVVTVPSLNGANIATAARAAAQQQSLNGVLIYIAKNDRQDYIAIGSAEARARWFTADTTATIRQSMEAQFKAEDFDGGITSAVGGILNVYRSHAGSLQNNGAGANNAVATHTSTSSGGIHISMFWWIVIFVVGFMILRSIMRASGPRNYGPTPPGGPVAGPGGAPMQGYGPMGGGYGGGGNFWSGMLGGLGGAFIGNELFGNRGGGNILGGGSGGADSGGGWNGGAGGGSNDGGGWGNDAGSTDMGSSSGGDFGGGGFGDMGGGGGGDMGGGGGGW